MKTFALGARPENAFQKDPVEACKKKCKSQFRAVKTSKAFIECMKKCEPKVSPRAVDIDTDWDVSQR